MSDVTAKGWPVHIKVFDLLYKISWENCRDKTCNSKDLSAPWCMFQFWLEHAFLSKLPPIKLKGSWARVGQGTSHSSSPSQSLFSIPRPIVSSRFLKRDSCSHPASPDEEHNLNLRHWLSIPALSGVHPSVHFGSHLLHQKHPHLHTSHDCSVQLLPVNVSDPFVPEEILSVYEMKPNYKIREKCGFPGVRRRLWDYLKPWELNLWFCKQGLSGKCCLLEPAPPGTTNTLTLCVCEGCVSGTCCDVPVSGQETYKTLRGQ